MIIYNFIFLFASMLEFYFVILFQPEWTFSLADNAFEISTVDDKTSPTIIILGIYNHFLNFYLN